MPKPRVLMLGWEFPPEISGGLGIASYYLCKALAPLTELTLVLPKADPEFRISTVNLIDLSRIKIEEAFEEDEIKQFEKIIKEKKIEFSFSPYPLKPLKKEIVTDKIITVHEKARTKSIKQVHTRFASSDLYGVNILDKVKYYAELVSRIAADLSFDIIHVHDWMTCPAGMMLKEKFKKPLVLHIHSLNYDRLGPDSLDWIYNIEKKALRRADLIIPVSHYTGGVIHEFYKISYKKIFPVHNGIEKVKRFRSEKNFPEKLILFMGRITMQKGPEYFLEAASKITNRMENVRFAIAGAGDKLKEIIESGSYGELGNKIHFTGFLKRQEVHYMLSIADVFCMPSVSEPFGLTALEAAQFGIPVVVSRQSGVAEVLHGALKVDFWDTEKMSELILDLLTNKKLYKNCVAQGFRDIKKLTWAETASKILGLYSRVIKR